jgi:hypothetical protein
MTSRFATRPANEGDRADLLALVRDGAQDGAVKIAYEREPDYFPAMSIPTPAPQLWVLEDKVSGRVVGGFNLGQRAVYVNGARRLAWYGNELRIHSSVRGGMALHRLFRQLKLLLGDDWMETVIMGDNQASLDTVASGRAGLPAYYPVGETRTHMLSTRARIAGPAVAGCDVQRARVQDLAELQAFHVREAARYQLAPAYDFAALGGEDPYYLGARLEDIFLLRRGGEIVAMAGLWDQTGFKQSRIIAYSPAIALFRPLYNLKSRLSGGLTLPKAGEISRYAYLWAVAVRGDDPALLRTLLRAMLKMVHEDVVPGPEALLLGFGAANPLNAAVDASATRSFSSRQFVSSWAGDPRPGFDTHRPFAIEPARL